jgi:hypothetical protein
MGILGNLTGETVARNAEAFRGEMEGVYGAVATRIIELLERSERQEGRLEAAEGKIEALRRRGSGASAGGAGHPLAVASRLTVSGGTLAWIVGVAASAGAAVAWTLTTVLR